MRDCKILKNAWSPGLCRVFVVTLIAVVVLLAINACGNTAARQTAPRATFGSPPAVAQPQPATARPRARTGWPHRAGTLRVLVEPQAGLGPVYRLIDGARSSVDLTMYELADPTAEADLAAAAARGADVRVILDQHLEKSRNQGAYDYLAAHGVHVRWAPPGTTFHQKTLTVDGTTSVVMTLNLVTWDYLGTRDFMVIDTRPADVAAITATFNADFAGRAITPPDGTDLVWSPTNAQHSVLSVINGADRTLTVEDEEMDDPAVTAALAAAAQRGVDVRIIMTANPEWDQAFTELARAGVHVRLYPDIGNALYLHAKAIVADAGLPGQRALVGSQNFSVASLGYNRELGILTRSPAVVAALSTTLTADYAAAEPYSPAPAPGPLPPREIRCLVHGHRKRLQRRREREQRLRPLQPALPRRDRFRRRLLAHLPDRQFRLRSDLPQRPLAGRADNRNDRHRNMHHQRLTSVQGNRATSSEPRLHGCQIHWPGTSLTVISESHCSLAICQPVSLRRHYRERGPREPLGHGAAASCGLAMARRG